MANLFSRNEPVDTSEEQWLSSRDPEQARWKYIKSISEFKKTVKIVTGEANGKLFDRVELADGLREGLKANPDASIQLIFHKDENRDRACQIFEATNSHILAIKREFPLQVHLHWAAKRPNQHYAIIDDKTTIFEQPNHPREEPFWGKIVKDSIIATEWETFFDEYIEYCPELTFELSPNSSV